MPRRQSLALWATFTCIQAFAPQLVRQTIRHQAAVTNEEAFTRQQALYDLVYVERIKPPETSAGGLFLVAPEDPPMHLAKVVSVGAGGQGNSGLVVENAGIKPGDLVYCKHPWGIGPKDEEFGEDGEERRFSFLRYTDIAGGVRKGGLARRVSRLVFTRLGALLEGGWEHFSRPRASNKTRFPINKNSWEGGLQRVSCPSPR